MSFLYLTKMSRASPLLAEPLTNKDNPTALAHLLAHRRDEAGFRQFSLRTGEQSPVLVHTKGKSELIIVLMQDKSETCNDRFFSRKGNEATLWSNQRDKM
jgi:hypothetical protein